MKISNKEFVNQIKEYFIKESGLSISKAKEIIKKQIVLDEFNNEYKVGNVKLFYTSNSNFCQGVKNGYGAGWYLSNISFHGGDYIKI
jgi:hypothetical protein